MKQGKAAAWIVAALVLGLVTGGVVTGGAAPAPEATATATAQGLGLKLGAAMRDAGGRLSDVVAKLTGQEAAEVVEQRQAGTSFADIAAKYDVTGDQVVAEAIEVRKQMLDSKVDAGALTEDQAAAALDRMKTRLTERVEATDESCTGTGGGGMGRGARDGSGGGGRGMGRGGAGCGGACTTAPAVPQ